MGRYFKGYYYKCCEGDRSFALIPALHTDGKRSQASLQVIAKDRAYTIPYSGIRFGKKKAEIRIGKNRFSEKGMRVDARTKECRIYGRLRFGGLGRIKYDIMGPFGCVPFMQCRHCVVSMGHDVRGRLNINGDVYHFRNGVGYIEGDCGTSFPKEYIWTQCHFADASLMLAVADIPFLGFGFKGVIGVVMIGDREYRLATYLGARLVAVGNREVSVRQGDFVFYARLLHADSQKLAAPVNGRMARTIHESVACRAYYRFTRKNKILLEEESDGASFEFEMKATIM